MILFMFENDQNITRKTEAFTSASEQFTCSDVIPTCPIGQVGMTSLQVNCSLAEVNASVFIPVF